MRGFRITALLLVLASMCPGVSRAGQQPAPDVATLYAAYAAGSFDIVARTIATRDDWTDLDDQVSRLARSWKSEASGRRAPAWQPRRVAFLVDVAYVVSRFNVDSAAGLAGMARDLTEQRPGLPGDSDGALDDGDRFEVAVHRMALAMLASATGHASTYLRSIGPRLSAFRRSQAGRHLISRIEIVPFLLAEADTRPFVRDETSLLSNYLAAFRGLGQSSAQPTTPPLERLRSELTWALERMPPPENLTTDVAAELSIRRGLALYRMQRYAEALDVLSDGLDHAVEPSVRYWGFLFRGRVLERTDRLAEAIAAYDEAVRAAWPRAQTAAVALSAARFIAGDRPQAEAWARLARTATAGDDPWWEYWYGDQRFARALLSELRSAKP